MTISLQLALDGSEKENVKAVLLTQNGSDVARWGENGSNLQDSVTVQAVETHVTVFYTGNTQDEGDIDPDSDGYVIITADGHGNTEIDYSIPID
ncbi:hypothetical protein [uncultured Sneathiella sp.]|uniref:hypothetical protein n=1 Tax=uncultured Sneathiella sp. TaxID=879315 RepID=UPI0030EE6575|tara:strand:- start:51544 stop:51825 length:282 start_codon:yes stop_codon:yes gene_type:complete